MNTDVGTGPVLLGHSLVRLLVCLHCTALIHLLACSLTRGKVNDQMSQNDLVLSHSAILRYLCVDALNFVDENDASLANNIDRHRSRYIENVIGKFSALTYVSANTQWLLVLQVVKRIDKLRLIPNMLCHISNFITGHS